MTAIPRRRRRRRLKRTLRTALPRAAHSLSEEWQRWVAENLLRGLDPSSLADKLAAQGLDPHRAAIEVAHIAASPILHAARGLATQSARVELALSVRRKLAALARDPTGVERRSGLSGDEFFERYYCQGAPVIITDIVPRWPAFGRWTPAYLKERFGDVEIKFTDGREADPYYDRNTQAHTTTATLANFIDRITAPGETNDLYMVANNRNLDKEALAGLFDDILTPEEYLDKDRSEGLACLWVGPAGTVTPLHHDTTNILFCQVHGRKRFRLISPLETSLFASIEGVYSPIDPEAPDFDRYPSWRDVAVREAVLEPGEALFIPVGAWHHVRALEPSISVSFTNFVRKNRFEWYLPGMIG